MKKIIWLSFAALAGMWTLLIWLLLRVTDAMLYAIAVASLPADTEPPEPGWFYPMMPQPWVESMRQTLLDFAQAANAVLPLTGGLSGAISTAAWIFWVCIMVGLLMLAGALHGLAGRKKGSSRNTGECRPDLEEEVLLIAVAVGA
ncbi:hypothetical protein, partial [Bordetella holmesii]